jgi:alkylated DNA nucleotide flippase Atl1
MAKPLQTPFTDRVLAVVSELPPGAVVTYGEVAVEAGRPGAARAVGNVLRGHGGAVPWWRVVSADGRLVPGLEEQHERLLAAEGIVCREGRVPRG